jgi:hypothetical protein
MDGAAPVAAEAATGIQRPDYETTTTFVASGPFAPSRASNVTFAPSGSDLKPSPAMLL